LFGTAGVAGVLVIPVLVSVSRSTSKGYDVGTTWLRAAIVGLVTLGIALVAFVALLVWALSNMSL